MTRSIRRFLVTPLALVLAAAALAGQAAAQPRLSGLTGAVIDTQLPKKLCGNVTPVIHSAVRAVPPAGSGATCRDDTECTGAGEYCGFDPGATTGTCRASGHLQRGNIDYVAGGLVDVDLTFNECAFVQDVLMSGASLTPAGASFDSTTAATWSIVSSSTTTIGGKPAVRQKIRIQFPNHGDGLSSPITVRVSGGGSAVAETSFTLARVAAVNAAMRSTVAETHVRNAFVKGLYERFGDTSEVFDANGKRIAYGLDWSQLTPLLGAQGIEYRGSDIRIGNSLVAFSTRFIGDAPVCDGPVNVDGLFDLVPADDSVAMRWVTGPRVRVSASLECSLLTLGIANLIFQGLADEEEIAGTFASSLSAGFGADEQGRIKICDLCRVVSVRIGSGRIDIYTLPPVDRVRLNASTTRGTDPTADPAQGLILPAGFYAPIAAGGTYESCQSVGSAGPATCAKKFDVDMDGLFNWWGNDIPVPSPIVYGQNGTAVVNGSRQAAWNRLLGLMRNTTQLPSARFPAGALLARRTPQSALTTTTRARVSNGCVMPPNAQAPYRVSFGVNDVAVPAGAVVPTRGKLDVTLLMALNAEQSQTLFGSRPVCQAEPGSTSPFGPGRITTAR